MKDRSVVEIIVIMLTACVGFAIVSLTFALIFVQIRDPETEPSAITATLISLISAMLGTLFGILISKGQRINRRPEKKEDE